MSTPRIDTVRNSIIATIELLEKRLAELETLHSLAYDRSAVRREIKIQDGDLDYSLDRHGDSNARYVYASLAMAMARGRDQIVRDTTNALAAIRDKNPQMDNSRKRANITAAEFLEAIEAQERRLSRGEYTPHRDFKQPLPAGVERTLRNEIKGLKRENQKLKREILKLTHRSG